MLHSRLVKSLRLTKGVFLRNVFNGVFDIWFYAQSFSPELKKTKTRLLLFYHDKFKVIDENRWERLTLWFFNGKNSCIFFLHSFIFLCVWLKIGLSSRETLFFNFPPHSCESNVTSFTVPNHAEALLLSGPVEDDKERLSVTGEGGWLKKTSEWKEPETEGSRGWWQSYAEKKYRACGSSRSFSRLLPWGCNKEPRVEI